MSTIFDLQIPVLGRGRGGLLELPARVEEGGPVSAPRCGGEAAPEAGGQGPRPGTLRPPPQESNAVRLPHRQDGEQPREGFRPLQPTAQRLEDNLSLCSLIHGILFLF